MKLISLNKTHQQGATLLEVIVSIFLLTFGILGLMAAQLRSVIVIGEAENRTIVAQAAENLAEGMFANANFKPVGNKGTYERNYDDYLNSGETLRSNTSIKTIKIIQPTVEPTNSNTNNKKDLAAAQLSEFKSYLINNLSNVQDTYIAICKDTPAKPGEPEIGNANCSGGNTTYIKVAWKMKKIADKSNDQLVTYSYVLPILNQ